jgi:hypothetical protein
MSHCITVRDLVWLVEDFFALIGMGVVVFFAWVAFNERRDRDRG